MGTEHEYGDVVELDLKIRGWHRVEESIDGLVGHEAPSLGPRQHESRRRPRQRVVQTQARLGIDAATVRGGSILLLRL